MAEQQLKLMREEYNKKIEAIQIASKSNLKFAQKMRVDQEKAKYKDPSSKRAVEFILGCQFDLEEVLGELLPLFDEDGEVVEGKAAEKDAFIKFMKNWGLERERKNKEEKEAYAMANSSRYGWRTEKFYRQDDIFLEEGEKKTALSVQEKLSKFRAAESQAKYYSQWAAKFDKSGGGRGRGAKRTRWGPPSASFTSSGAAAGSGTSSMLSAAGGGGNYIPGAFQAPRVPPICFKCSQSGHIKRDCPQK